MESSGTRLSLCVVHRFGFFKFHILYLNQIEIKLFVIRITLPLGHTQIQKSDSQLDRDFKSGHRGLAIVLNTVQRCQV